MNGTGSLAEPFTLAPPWIHIITGSAAGGIGNGVHTLTYRQSSSLLAAFCSLVSVSCAQRLPKCVASRTVFHGSGFCGAFQRKSPTGGLAYGMPTNCRLCAVV